MLQVRAFMQERRRLERFKLSAPARLVVQNDGGAKEQLDLTTKDVSSGGAFLYSRQPLAEGASVRMEFLVSLGMLQKLAGERQAAKIKVKGRVVRVDEDGIAVRFDNAYKITAFETGQNKDSPF
jgi:hypothetical protein